MVIGRNAPVAWRRAFAVPPNDRPHAAQMIRGPRPARTTPTRTRPAGCRPRQPPRPPPRPGDRHQEQAPVTAFDRKPRRQQVDDRDVRGGAPGRLSHFRERGLEHAGLVIGNGVAPDSDRAFIRHVADREAMRLRHRNAFEHGLQGLGAPTTRRGPGHAPFRPSVSAMRVCSPSGRPHRLSRARGIGTRRLPLAGRLPGRGHRGTRATETPGGAVCRRIDGVSASVQSRFARPRPHLGVRYRGWTLSRDLSLRQSGRTGRLRTTGRRHLFKTVTRGGIELTRDPGQATRRSGAASRPVAGLGRDR